jgi:hypothetical protein
MSDPYDSDSSSDDYHPHTAGGPSPSPPKSLDEILKEKNVHLDYNGMSYDDYGKLRLPFGASQKMNTKYCYSCNYYYPGDFVVQYNTSGFVNDDDWMCYHCLYWINYSPEQRILVDGVFGKTIAEYIIDCKEIHNQASCTRNPNCFICNHLDGINIELIQCEELVNIPHEQKESDQKKIEDDLLTIEI